MYKIWRSKQHSSFCGTRVQVGCYSGEILPGKRCANCGRHETTSHLMLCSDEDCTRLLTETVNRLAKWMAKDNITDLEILYWIPTYILMREDKPLSQIGFMSPQFNALTTSQDLIGWRDFTEGYVSIFQHTSTRFRRSISQCRVVISMGRIGLNSSSPRFFNLLTLSGFSGTYPSMTKRTAIYKTKRQTNCSST